MIILIDEEKHLTKSNTHKTREFPQPGKGHLQRKNPELVSYLKMES